MLIDETQLKHWIGNFYGYGSWRAKIWFIGYEEGGGDLPEEVAEKHGMSNIQALKNSVQEFFPAAKFKMAKGIKLQIPQHHRADVDGTTLLITTQIPALRHNRIESGFDWQEFGKIVKAEN